MADISKSKHNYIQEASKLLDAIRIGCHQINVQSGKQRYATLKEMKKNCNKLVILSEIAFKGNIKIIKKIIVKITGLIDLIVEMSESGQSLDLNEVVEQMLTDLTKLEDSIEENSI